MKKLFLLSALLIGCTDEGATYATLNAQGYTHIRLTGYEFSCGKGDDTCTGFTALGPTGVHVQGAVGCGWWMKGCTVRITGTAQ